MIKAIVFDWDGVIVNSMSWIARAIQETALSYGINISIDDVLNGYFQPCEAFYSSVGIDITNQEELKKRHKASIDKHKKIAPLFPEVADILKFLKTNNYKLGVGSSTGAIEIIEQLKFFGLEGIFSADLIFGGGAPKEGKLKKFLEVFNISSDELLYVGDLPSDIEAARVAGVKAAGIERREIGRKRLSSLSPDYLFSSLNDLKNLLAPNTF